MTAFLDWITQQLTSASLWIQSPIVILASVLVCAVLAVPLLRIIDILGAWVLRVFSRESRNDPSAGIPNNTGTS